jgi:hypothetical protein
MRLGNDSASHCAGSARGPRLKYEDRRLRDRGVRTPLNHWGIWPCQICLRLQVPSFPSRLRLQVPSFVICNAICDSGCLIFRESATPAALFCPNLRLRVPSLQRACDSGCLIYEPRNGLRLRVPSFSPSLATPGALFFSLACDSGCPL